ncbi:alpha/beta hydrolase [Massilia putida]|uniref:alpha/beta hydrolase n=1 Tax=Massilia putida TaxID=1141883 RepID=UPI001C54ECED|nr:alpha/beta hydrolase [Massilia putida]
MFKRSTRLCAALLAGLSITTLAGAAGPDSRADAVNIIADMRRIVTPQGIEETRAVRIGGIEQWISVRGTDRRNPVLLMLHGGPGYVSMPTSWYFQRGWEEYFTVVQWDQRGAGKTYTANDPAKVAPTMTRARMLLDAEEMVAFLRKEFGKDRIFVLGHSWGSSLGIQLAQRHPDWLHAYIGIGQITDGMESERRGWRFTMDAAQREGNREAIRELASIAPYAAPGKPLVLKDLYLQRKWLARYGGAVYGRTGSDAESNAVKLAPEYTDADLRTIWDATEFSSSRMLTDVLSQDFSVYTTFSCPIVIFNGRHDYNVSASAAAEWFAKVKAPSKQLVRELGARDLQRGAGQDAGLAGALRAAVRGKSRGRGAVNEKTRTRARAGFADRGSISVPSRRRRRYRSPNALPVLRSRPCRSRHAGCCR